VSPSVKKGSSGRVTARVRNAGNLTIPRTVLVLGTRTDPQVHVSSAALGVAALETDAVEDTLTLLFDDLGPGQETDTELELAIGGTYTLDTLAFGLSGKAMSLAAHDAFLATSAELLRSAVLADPASSASLLARAATQAGWLGSVLAGLPPNLSALHVPGTPATSGREWMRQLAQAAAVGLPPGGQVQETALSSASGGLFCAPFLDGAFDCSTLAPPGCGTAQAGSTISVAEGANVPVGVVCCATPTSNDPNEKTSPPGFGFQRQVSAQRGVEYRIYFENVAAAAAPASLVRLTDRLEPVFRAASVRLQTIRFGSTVITLPENTISYQNTLDLSTTLGVLVQITAGVNAASNEVFAEFQSLDPQTGEPITDGVRGFLPPNDGSGRGSGYMSFVAGTNGGVVVTGTTARNSASVVFDRNASNRTNEVSNTFDATPPSSTVTVTSGLVPGFDYILSWSAAEEAGGSGVASYTILASKDGGPFAPIVSDTSATTLAFHADQGSTYAFYSLAQDNTGNEEPPPDQPDATVVVPPDCNGNHVPDGTDIASGASVDCDGNQVPDECQPDIDGDGRIDACDNCPLISNPAQEDCDADGAGDVCELAAGAPDCNHNGLPDTCDIASGTSQDVNGNGVLDECEANGGTPFCFGDAGCPCGNTSGPGTGEGCRNSTGSGAKLLGAGWTSVSTDSFVLSVTQLPSPNPPSFVMFFQGDADVGGAPFHDGKLCTGGAQIRLATKSNVTGSSAFPQAGDLSVSARGLVPAAGGARYYQVWYRNNLGPCGTGSNVSNGVAVVWTP
jgi:hypothetical protein